MRNKYRCRREIATSLSFIIRAITALRRTVGIRVRTWSTNFATSPRRSSVANTVRLATLPSSWLTVSARGTDNVMDAMSCMQDRQPKACRYNRPNTSPRLRVTQAACMLQGPRHLASWAATTSATGPISCIPSGCCPPCSSNIADSGLSCTASFVPRRFRGCGDHLCGLAARQQRGGASTIPDGLHFVAANVHDRDPRSRTLRASCNVTLTFVSKQT